jgi:hypothetical protein
MSHSFHSVDRTGHYKVIAVAFALSVMVGLIALYGRPNHNLTAANGVGVIKAGKVTHVTGDDARVIR